MVFSAIGTGTKYCQDFYVVLMRFVYLGSQTYDCFFSVLEVFLVFRKNGNLRLKRLYFSSNSAKYGEVRSLSCV